MNRSINFIFCWIEKIVYKILEIIQHTEEISEWVYGLVEDETADK